MAYTDAQKSQIIKDYVAATPVPDYKFILTLFALLFRERVG